MKEERFKQLFAAFGTLTDCSLKFTKDGKFRKFGFIGFKSEEEAQKALNHFNRSFVDTSRITVSRRQSYSCLSVETDLSLHPPVPFCCDVIGVPHLFSIFQAYRPPGELVKTVFWGPFSEFLIQCVGDPRICTFNKLTGDAIAPVRIIRSRTCWAGTRGAFTQCPWPRPHGANSLQTGRGKGGRQVKRPLESAWSVLKDKKGPFPCWG